MTDLKFSPLNRRSFLSYVALGTLGLLTKDLLDPASAMADNEGLGKNFSTLENYHIFVPFTTARNGGTQTFTLRSGEPCQVEISSKTQDSQEITIKGRGQDNKDITVVLHTLYDRQIRIADRIYQEIDKNTQFVEEASKDKCKSVYEQVEDGKYINDLIALDFLDYIINTSTLDKKIQDCYQLASTNSRLLGIEQAIESTLAQSQLNDTEKKLIRGTFAYVRAGEPVPDFKALTDIDSIVASSALPLEIKQNYSLSSANSRGLTVDFIIVKLINYNHQITSEQAENYLSIYRQVRDGKTVKDTATLESLDSFILNADILENAKVVYLIARTQNLKDKKDFDKIVDGILQNSDNFKKQLSDFRKQLKEAKNTGESIVPLATRILGNLGVETATGVSISSLSGGAATNATLAALGGGSVAAGGLGMLGGLAFATGGAALIGAAGILSIALVSEMDREDQKNLGIAFATGTLAGTATVLAAWTAASVLGVTGTLSGAAAITATIAALGGLSFITGGAALVASGTAFVIWSFLKSGKTRDQSILKQLETRSYTYTEDSISGDLGELIQKNVGDKDKSNNIFSAPNIPLDKLSNALSAWISVDPDEKVMALIDTSGFWGKGGVVFTDRRLISTKNSSQYKNLARFVNTETKLYSLLSDDKQKNKLSKLKKVVDILSDGKASKNLSKLKDVIDILSNKEYDLASFFPPQLVSQLSDEQYRNDLSELKEVVDTLSNEADKDKLTQLLREIGLRYSTV